jgi:hypothetical protein
LNSFSIGWVTNEEFQNKIQNIHIYLNEFVFFVNHLTFVSSDKKFNPVVSTGIRRQKPEKILPKVCIALAHGHARSGDVSAAARAKKLAFN